MKAILSSRIHHYVERVGIFLIMASLIVGMPGCEPAGCAGGQGANPPGTQVRYNLTVAPNPVGGGTATDLTNASPYATGTAVSIQAVANPGYRFVSWTAAPVGGFANATAANTTFTMPAQNVTVTANFIAQYDLTIDSTGGGEVITPGEGASIYDAGTVVDLVVSPASGYRFVNWTGDVGIIANVSAASTTITMNGAYNITANFIAQYDLTIDSTDGGDVTTPGEGTHTYDAGTVVDIVASPASGYQFVNWTGDVSTIANANAATTNITMSGNYSITANFAVTLFQAVHFGQNQGNWNVGLWKYYGNGTQDGYVNHGGSGAVRWDDGSQGTDNGLTHNFTLSYDPTTCELSFQVTGGSKTVLETTTSPVVPPAAPGPVNNLHMVIQATAGTLVQCASQSSMPQQQVDYSKTTVSDLALDGTPLAGIEVEAKLVDNPTSQSFTNKAELDIPVPTGVAWTLTGEIAVSFVVANMAAPPKQWRIGMPQLSGQYVFE